MVSIDTLTHLVDHRHGVGLRLNSIVLLDDLNVVIILLGFQLCILVLFVIFIVVIE